MTSDVANLIREYEAWKAQQKFQDDDGENYARHLETQKELRILNAVRHHFDVNTNHFIDLNRVRAAFEGSEADIQTLENEVEMPF